VDYETEVGSISEQIAQEIDSLYGGQWQSEIYLLKLNPVSSFDSGHPFYSILTTDGCFYENNRRINSIFSIHHSNVNSSMTDI
jgi:hypothetical protein